jgi:hypothetical protein
MWIDGKGATVLSAPECRRLLAVAAQGGWIGRIGVPTEQAPVVVPVNFSLRHGQVLLRVGPGFFAQASAGRLVAFEIDHIDSEDGTAWSVLVRGLATLSESPTGSRLAPPARPLVPEPGDMELAIRQDVVTGRRFTVHREP